MVDANGVGLVRSLNPFGGLALIREAINTNSGLPNASKMGAYFFLAFRSL